MNSSADIAATYFLDDVPGATIPASRLHAILQRVTADRPLTVFQQEFLRERGHNALLQLALGELDIEAFRANAQAEREGRLRAKAAAEQKEAAERRLREEATNRKNDALFAKREERLERRRLLNRFGQHRIERMHDGRVMRILRSVEAGNPIDKDDLLWLGSDGADYWTAELRKANHGNLAKDLTDAWHRTGDAWQAINACAHWRKAGAAEQGLTIVDEALGQTSDAKLRSAALTTRGGALRDLRRKNEAKQSGLEAHSLTPHDFRPCTLLGAVHIEIGSYAEGAEWYEKAEARGAKPDLIDREIQSILDAARPEERERIKIALRSRNASRYGWI